MIQSNGKHDNGQNQENGVKTTFSQDWLGADGMNVPVANPGARVVGRLPNLVGDTENVDQTLLKSRRSGGKTSVVAFVAFGLGVAASFGGSFWLNGTCFLSHKTLSSEPVVASETSEIPTKRRDFFNDALPEVTSSTLRSVPENPGGGLDGTFPSVAREGKVFSRYGNEFSGVDINGGESATSLKSESGDFLNDSSNGDPSFADEIIRQNAPIRSNDVKNLPGSVQESEYNRFERRSTNVADVPNATFANRDDFPTWDDLETNVARNRIAANASNVFQTPKTAKIGSSYMGNNGFNDYPTANFQVPVAPVASGSQNSEYNNVNGTGGFTGFAQNVDANGAPVLAPEQYVAQVPPESVGVPASAPNFNANPNLNSNPNLNLNANLNPNAVPPVSNAAPARTLRW